MSSIDHPDRIALIAERCINRNLFFTKYFFKNRQNIKFKINWHHIYIADELEKILTGETENLIINVPPGSSKTEMAIINFIARGLALNPRSRFLHISYSDDLALLNSQTSRDLVKSDEYQELFPLAIAPDSKAKNRWNVLLDGKPAGGVYAVSLAGQITGFRAGHMAPGFQGAILIDDPLKPEDAFSKTKVDAANRKLLTTIKSRKANPKTPTIMIMQRISDNDPTAFTINNKILKNCKHIVIPAILDEHYINSLPEKYRALIDRTVVDEKGRCSYWEYKEPIADLCQMEAGGGMDQTGNRISRHVFAGQYMQNPVAIGGNLIRGEWFHKWEVLPLIKYRKIYVDTAQKVKEHNDYSVFALWGYGVDGRIYLLDMMRGKWEAPDLKKNAVIFWNKHNQLSGDSPLGALREMLVEDKVSGTGLIQELKRAPYNIPVKGIERNSGTEKTGHSNDKLTRVMDAIPYLEAGQAAIPLNANFTADFIAEHEAFMPDDTHAFDDQVDTTVDAVKDMLSTKNKMKVWEQLAQQ